MNRETFTVDAALLQELGERLIGRAHIALSELIKNSFDADAITCEICFEDDKITILDDGHGMSEKEFLDHWMRIGTTHKVALEKSRLLNRSLTGSKGIGRLSAQFLASEMELWSTSLIEPDKTLYAIVDWKNISHGKDLSTVEVLWEMIDDSPQYPGNWKTGTQITLRGLKTDWDAESLEDLGSAVWILRSPFSRSGKPSMSRTAEEFYIELNAPSIKGAHDAFDKMRANLFENWRARIEGNLERGRHGGKLTVSVEFDVGYPDGLPKGQSFSETVVLPVRIGDGEDGSLVDNAKFSILIFKPEGRQASNISVGDMRKYLATYGNVTVYDSGFRLPYYGSGGDKTGQDWLNIALDQGRRLNASELLPERLKAQTRYMQDLPAPGRLFGAVYIDTNHERAVAEYLKAPPGEWLQIQSSRDRLHSNPAFFQLRDIVRLSLDLYANRYRMLSLQLVEKARHTEPSSRKFDRALDVLERGKAHMPAAVYQEVRREVKDAHKGAVAEEEALDRRAVLLAPLATAGMAALALSHELAREKYFLETAGEKLQQVARSHPIPELLEIVDEFDTLRGRLQALQELFAPLLSADDSEATDRLSVRPLVQQVVRSMRPLLPRVEFDLTGISSYLRFPVGSFADWSALLQNVLANAWNAMLDTERPEISFEGDRSPNGREWLLISDRGRGLGMPPADAAKLFEPFERHLEISPDNRSIAIGGQGLGLTISRMIAHRRGGRVRFIPPHAGYSTTFELSWRGAPR